jgi:hypothetical protein
VSLSGPYWEEAYDELAAKCRALRALAEKVAQLECHLLCEYQQPGTCTCGVGDARKEAERLLAVKP